MPYTPILVRRKNNHYIQVKAIESLVSDGAWFPKEDWDASATLKEFSSQPFSNYEVWTDRGWSPIIKIIRHKSNKRILRVKTTCNMMSVDVTEDHSIMSAYRIPIRPHVSLIGMPLLVALPNMKDLSNKFDIESTISDNAHVQFQKRFLKQCLQTQLSFDQPVTIGSIEVLHTDWTGYVYDIQTSEGVFQAGIGCLIVKNTDEIII